MKKSCTIIQWKFKHCFTSFIKMEINNIYDKSTKYSFCRIQNLELKDVILLETIRLRCKNWEIKFKLLQSLIQGKLIACICDSSGYICIWIMEIDLDSSVVEHLTSDTVIPGSIPGPTVNFHLYFFVPVHSSHSYYNYIII